jgi:hypothetical protein
MPDRDKLEPDWSRGEAPAPKEPPSRKSRSRKSREARDSRRAKSREIAPPEEPQEPSFNITSAERRSAIAGLIATSDDPSSRRSPFAPGPVAPSALTPAAGRDEAPALEPRSESRRLAEITPVATSPGLTIAPVPPPTVTPPPGGWVQLSDAQAMRHPLHGLGFWLAAIALLIAIGIARALIEILDFWATTDHGGLAAWIMAVLRSAMALWGTLLLGTLIGHSRAFPTNFAAYAMMDNIYLVLFGLAFAHVTNNYVFYGVAVGVGLNLLALAYVLYSPRANVTFRRRVRARRVKTKRTPAATATA